MMMMTKSLPELHCVYCGRVVTEAELTTVDEDIASMDSELAELIMDELPSIRHLGSRSTHTPHDYPVWNLCPRCWANAKRDGDSET